MERATRAALIEDVARIVLDLVSFEQRNEFVLEASAAMMLLLSTDVRNDGRQIGTTHAECAISALPRKSISAFIHPPRGVGFQFGNSVRGFHIRRDPQEHVDVIVGAADRVMVDAKIVCNPGEVIPHSLRLSDEWLTVFCAEYDVKIVATKALCHVSPLQGSTI
jgi:hypothetical protein